MLPVDAIQEVGGRLTMTWRQWFARADQTVEAQRRVGPTASRPGPRDAYPGMQFLDTDLGKPIWALAVVPAGVTWIDATGATV